MEKDQDFVCFKKFRAKVGSFGHAKISHNGSGVSEVRRRRIWAEDAVRSSIHRVMRSQEIPIQQNRTELS